MSRGTKFSRQKDKNYLYGKRSFGKKGQYITVTGTISRFGKKQVIEKGAIETWKTTVCIHNVKDITGNKLSDHLWIMLPDGIRLNKGEVIKFEGQVGVYSKLDYDLGGYKTNYELKNIRNLSVVS